MRRFFIVLVVLCLSFSFSACYGKDNAEGSAPSVSHTPASSEPAVLPSESESVSSEESYAEGIDESLRIPEGETFMAVPVVSIDSKVPFGESAQVAQYAPLEDAYYPAELRLVDVITDPDTLAQFAEVHNRLSYGIGAVDFESDDYKVPDNIQWCIIAYDVTLPEDFPVPEVGSFNLWHNFSRYFGENPVEYLPTLDGKTPWGGLMHSAKPLYTEEYNLTTSVQAGSTYRLYELYPMIKDCNTYVFATLYMPTSEAHDVADLDWVYFACPS